MVIAASVVSFLAILLLPVLLARFRKRQVAAFHRAFTTRIASRFAARARHCYKRGSKVRQALPDAGKCFPEADGFRIALTDGRDSGWVRNLLAPGSFRLETCGVLHQLSAPGVFHDPSGRRFPFIVRRVLARIDANDFLELTIAGGEELRSDRELRGAHK
jgi:hypothetical protein